MPAKVCFCSSSSLHSFSRPLLSIVSIRFDYFLLLPFVHPDKADPSLPGILRLCRPTLRSEPSPRSRLGASTSDLDVYSGGAHTHSCLAEVDACDGVPGGAYKLSFRFDSLPLGLSSPVVHSFHLFFSLICYLVSFSASASASYCHTVILMPPPLDILGLNDPTHPPRNLTTRQHDVHSHTMGCYAYPLVMRMCPRCPRI